ncbi:MAG: hypothetical protein RLZZ387_887 [Chloroflexota bacterium]|jgi:hypothetical protein
MSHEEAATTTALRRFGISVTQDASTGAWGWSVENERLIRQRVGAYATSAEAGDAALDWFLDKAWRGVLYPILYAVPSDSTPFPELNDVTLLDPWKRAFEHNALPIE